jgi:deoxycytidylate deaminase
MSKIRHVITAIIYDKRGRIISIGKNSYIKTHPKQAYHAKLVGLPEKQYRHAEIDAIIRCKKLDKAHKIIVSRLTKGGKYGNAKPCPICVSAIKEAGIKQVEWTK